MSPDDVVVTLTAGLLATGCALLGCFLLLRRQALVSDAVSHAVLPGVVAVYLLTGDRGGVVTLTGAALFGVACVMGAEVLRRTGRVGADATIALAFPALFSLGVVGVSSFASGAHLDLDATIYGEITFAPLRTSQWGPVAVPDSLLSAGGAALGALGFVVGCWRGLSVATFDPAYAEVTGLRGRLAGRLLVVAVACVAVSAFESVGAILIVTFFIVPAATAHLLARRLDTMLAVAVVTGWTSALVGQRIADAADASVPGTIGLAAAGCFTLALLFAPGTGALSRLRHRYGVRRC